MHTTATSARGASSEAANDISRIQGNAHMQTVRRFLWIAGMLLLAHGLAACSTPATSIGASPSNVSQPSAGAPGMPSQLLALPAVPALPVSLDAPAGVDSGSAAFRYAVC